MQDLIAEYKQARKHCLKMADEAPESDRTYWRGMAGDCEYVIQWLETGRDPAQYRGIENPNAYHKEIPVDPQLFPFEKYQELWIRGGGIDNEKLELLAEAKEKLTEKQWEAFEMYYAGMYSFSEIAEMLGISKPAAFYRVKGALFKLNRGILNESA